MRISVRQNESRHAAGNSSQRCRSFVQDGGSPPLSSSATLTIRVQDPDNFIPKFLNVPITFFVREREPSVSIACNPDILPPPLGKCPFPSICFSLWQMSFAIKRRSVHRREKCGSYFRFSNASGHHWTVSRATSARVVERNGVSWQTMKCESATTSRQCHISLIPARWLNSTVVCNVYTLQTKLLLIGWRHNGT